MNRARALDSIEIEFGGEALRLLAERAVVWPRENTLFVADVHLGKAASFRAAGVAVPSGHSRDDLARLSRLIEAHGIERLVVLGDLVHNRASYTPALDSAIAEFNARHRSLDRVLVLGNHDAKAGAPSAAWQFRCVDEDLRLTPLLAAHEPHESSAQPDSLPRICGHIHPAVSLRTTREVVTLPCFWQQPRQLILPSFGSLTGRYVVDPAPQDVTFVVTHQQIFRIPKSAL